MLLDSEVAGFSRCCAATGRSFAPGETYFSTLSFDKGETVRRDLSAEAWTGPPTETVAWWKSRVPDAAAAKPQLAPRDVLLDLFARLAEQPAEAAFRYVLGLLLTRRKLLKLHETRSGPLGDVMALDCPSRDEQFELLVVEPAADEADRIEQRLVELLSSGQQPKESA
jgi:hypothetical protein